MEEVHPQSSIICSVQVKSEDELVERESKKIKYRVIYIRNIYVLKSQNDKKDPPFKTSHSKSCPYIKERVYNHLHSVYCNSVIICELTNTVERELFGVRCNGVDSNLLAAGHSNVQ